MGAMMNGMAAHGGVVPVGVPYLFSPGIWWSGLSLNRSGSRVHRLQMNS
jgi:hypothetical protein